MKKFIILYGTVDGDSCEADGFLECATFGLASCHMCDTLEEAVALRDQIIEKDLVDMHKNFEADDEDLGITFEVYNFDDTPESDKYVDVKCWGNVFNETTYKIAEVMC